MFWLKKIISQLVMPIPLTLLLLLTALIVWRTQSKKLKFIGQSALISAFTIILLLSNSQFSAWIAGTLESQYHVNNFPLIQVSKPVIESKYESISDQDTIQTCYVMVLGSGHTENAALTGVQQLSSTALARLSEGVRQLKLADNRCKLVVSGWNGGLTPTPHADIMRQAAIELGVAKASIITFPEALDTIEEAKSMRNFINTKPFILVTSATHMPRSMMIFASQGLNPIAAPTNFISSPGHWWRFSAGNLFISQRSIHEYIGTLWLKIKGLMTDV
ncbi:YdcF family protein [Shewanella donghaensis]|uniref:YdcF family protein n=1 Tax=Shewanella donghaensis TaxID=238836 RepID=UPI00118269A7|nr:ElyC/SanA/YdcF family protein [Shewanella donghaensis]